MASADGELFNDTFVIKTLDVHTDDDKQTTFDKKFDKVSRIDADSENYSTKLTLDVNMELYPLRQEERVRLLLSSKLGGDDDGDVSDLPGYDPTKALPDRADRFDYIMFGKIYKYDSKPSRGTDPETATVYASFGGLLMALTGNPQTLGARAFNVDASLYLFLAKEDEG